MRLTDIRDQHISSIGRHAHLVVGQEMAFSLNHQDGQLPFQIVAMDREKSACLQVEIENLKKFRIMEHNRLHPQRVEFPCSGKLYFSHNLLLMNSWPGVVTVLCKPNSRLCLFVTDCTIRVVSLPIPPYLTLFDVNRARPDQRDDQEYRPSA